MRGRCAALTLALALALATLAHAGVHSYNRRTGHVMPQAGDYTCAQVGCPTPALTATPTPSVTTTPTPTVTPTPGGPCTNPNFPTCDGTCPGLLQCIRQGPACVCVANLTCENVADCISPYVAACDDCVPGLDDQVITNQNGSFGASSAFTHNNAGNVYIGGDGNLLIDSNATFFEQMGRVAAPVHALLGHGNFSGPLMTFERKRGVRDAEQPIQLGDSIGVIEFLGADSDTYMVPGARIVVEASDNPTTENVPMRIRFLTDPNLYDNQPDTLTLEANGDVRLSRLPDCAGGLTTGALGKIECGTLVQTCDDCVPGSDGQILYNQAGSFGAAEAMTYLQTPFLARWQVDATTIDPAAEAEVRMIGGSLTYRGEALDDAVSLRWSATNPYGVEGVTTEYLRYRDLDGLDNGDEIARDRFIGGSAEAAKFIVDVENPTETTAPGRVRFFVGENTSSLQEVLQLRHDGDVRLPQQTNCAGGLITDAEGDIECGNLGLACDDCVPGSESEVIFNSGGSFAANPGLMFNPVGSLLSINDGGPGGGELFVGAGEANYARVTLDAGAGVQWEMKGRAVEQNTAVNFDVTGLRSDTQPLAGGEEISRWAFWGPAGTNQLALMVDAASDATPTPVPGPTPTGLPLAMRWVYNAVSHPREIMRVGWEGLRLTELPDCAGGLVTDAEGDIACGSLPPTCEEIVACVPTPTPTVTPTPTATASPTATPTPTPTTSPTPTPVARQFGLTLMDPQAALQALTIPTVWDASAHGLTLVRVCCEVDDATGDPTINLQRDDGTPADVLSADLACVTNTVPSTITGCTDTFVNGEDAIALDEKLDLVMRDNWGTAQRLNVTVHYTLP